MDIVELEYYNKDTKKWVYEKLDYKHQIHYIVFYGYKYENRKISRYISIMNYTYNGESENGKHGRYVRLSKDFKLMSEKRLQEIENRLIMYKLTN
jgi:hypothetical protein